LVLFFKKEQKEKPFFFEKKKQKTFDYCVGWLPFLHVAHQTPLLGEHIAQAPQ